MAGCYCFPNGGCRIYKDGSCRCSINMPKVAKKVTAAMPALKIAAKVKVHLKPQGQKKPAPKPKQTSSRPQDW